MEKLNTFNRRMQNNQQQRKWKAVSYAILAAMLYGISSPVSKLLLEEIAPTFMAALLYLGAGAGMLCINLIKNVLQQEKTEARMTLKELPYVVGMIALDIIAPIFLMFGLTMTSAANAALLNNFEIVATSLIALFIFTETVGMRMWVAITLITISSMILTIADANSLSFSWGSVFVLLACIFWGLENNCTRMLSLKDPMQIVVIKGFGSGIGSLLIAVWTKQISTHWLFIFYILLLGFVAYGMSIFLYVKAQRELGAARTSAYYAAAPFIGVFISWILFKDTMTSSFIVALVIMLLGTYFAVSEEHQHEHLHEEMTHEHKHNHHDGHHNHTHTFKVREHSHEHTHEVLKHAHTHLPDLHHQHRHS